MKLLLLAIVFALAAAPLPQAQEEPEATKCEDCVIIEREPPPLPTTTTTTTTTAVPAPSESIMRKLMVTQAVQSVLGTPYVWAGATPTGGFDCSGLIMWAYAKVGMPLPHSSRSLRSMTPRITEAALQPGDLVFGGNPVHHVGMYIGDGKMIHAPRSGDVVKVSGIYGSAKPVSFGELRG